MQNDSINKIKNKYSFALPYLSHLNSERSQKIFGIALTLCALSFFGIFAISPTISTILTLRNEIKDNEYVLNQMEVKIKNLNNLKRQYANLQIDLPAITNAITTQPEAHLLLAQIQGIAQMSNITISSLQSSEVEILKSNNSVNKDYYSYSFSLEGTGSSENIYKFIQTLTSMERIVNIDSLSIGGSSNLDTKSAGFNIRGTTYFKDSL